MVSFGPLTGQELRSEGGQVRTLSRTQEGVQEPGMEAPLLLVPCDRKPTLNVLEKNKNSLLASVPKYSKRSNARVAQGKRVPGQRTPQHCGADSTCSSADAPRPPQDPLPANRSASPLPYKLRTTEEGPQLLGLGGGSPPETKD